MVQTHSMEFTSPESSSETGQHHLCLNRVELKEQETRASFLLTSPSFESLDEFLRISVSRSTAPVQINHELLFFSIDM